MNVPTGYTALDLVGFTDKGTYASNVYYVKNDIVHYGGNLWRCKVDDTVNVTPAEGANWTVFVGEPTNLVERIIAPLEENPATVAYATGRQIIYDDWLWEVIDDIAVDDVLIDYAVDPQNANIKKADPVETQLLAIKAKEGNLSNLNTTAKTDLVSAINEVDGEIGNLSSLDTTVKTSAVAAINEVNTKVSKTEDLIAYVQTTLTASKAYAVGEQFIYNGLLYKATATIAQGETITIGGNCALADSVTEQIGNIKDTLDMNNFGNAVDLASYTTTAYLCPRDGFAYCSCAATADARASMYIYGNIGTVYAFIGGRGNGTYSTWSCFVKKGMRLKVDELANGGIARFIPLV